MSDTNPPPNSNPGIEESWEDLKPALDIPRMTDDQLREFVLGVVDGRIFTDRQARNDPFMVFFPPIWSPFAGYNQESMKNRLGCIYEYVDKALPRAINGQPCFMSMRVMHIDDWKRASAAITAEVERRKTIKI